MQSTPLNAFDNPAASPGTPSIIGDEDALRRSYDQLADALHADVAQRLGETAYLAPRVTEQAFINAWHARKDITSEPALSTYLSTYVQHAVPRVLSRREAAHRMAGSGRAQPHEHAPYNHAISWDHVLTTIHGENHDAAARARATEIAHHEAASHIAEVTRHGSWVKPALFGAGALALALAGVWALDQFSKGAKVESAVTKGVTRTIESTPGRIAAVTLAEGSRVRLAPDSRVFIPDKFGPDLRGVRLEGAAAFEVAPGLPEPLVVVIRDATITATGTAFTVRAYPGETSSTIALQEGSVTVRVGRKEERTLSAGEALIIADSVARSPTAGELAEATTWTDNRLTVTNRRLGDVLPEFRRWYRTDILVGDPNLLDRRVSFTTSLDSVRQAIAMVEKAASVKFGYVSDRMVFTDAAPGAKRK